MARPIPDMDQMTPAEVAADDSIIIDDTSAGETKRIDVGDLLGLPKAGWQAAGEVWAYASWSSGNRVGTITVPTNATTKYTPGMRVQITQATGGTKYGIILAVSATLLTVFFPSGTTFNNEAITTPFFSVQKVPFGFNADPSIWKLRFDISDAQNKAAGSYMNPSSAQLSVPVGAWKFKLNAILSQDNGTAEGIYILAGISTATNSMTDGDLKVGMYGRFSSTSGIEQPVYLEADKIIGSQTTYYVNIVTAQVGGTTAIGIISGYNGNSYFEVICNYL